MPLEFVFASLEATKWKELHQGDVLAKTEQLKDALAQAHSYYAEAEDYTHFLVLTQSCDLVFRGRRKPRSRYITLAAIRPLSILVDRLLEKYRFDFEFPIWICEKEREILISQTLERLLHNTEEGYFFLKAASHPNIQMDLCVFLSLSVALRIDHCEACIDAKVAQLDNIFQAKVGWLAGNLYSRVGTPDLEEIENDSESIKQSFYDEVIYRRTAWMTAPQLKRLKEIVRQWKKDNSNQEVTHEIARVLISQVPELIDMVAERAVSQLVAEKMLPDDDDTKTRAINLLRNDTNFKRLVKSAH